MFLSGFADEAGKDLTSQIEATRRLGWSHIELRAVGDKNLASLNDAEFESLSQLLDEAKIKINCFGSSIANWSKSPLNDADFEADMVELKAAIPRMQKLGTKLVRGMSYKIDPATEFDSPEMEKIIFDKISRLVKLCEDSGIVYGHENCMNYGGQSYVHTLRLLDHIGSPNFRLIFDTGNPVFTFKRIGDRPYKLQDAWEFYRNVREFICHVHIKDCLTEGAQNDLVSPPQKYIWPGEGSGKVREIVTDLKQYGYDAGFSIEPHVAVVFHDGHQPDDSEAAKMCQMESYVEYGRRFERLVSECGWDRV